MHSIDIQVMCSHPASELIQAEENNYPLKNWIFTQVDISCLSMVIRGTWVFDKSLDIDCLKEGLKKLLNHYPHLCGRMTDKTGIELNNAGVLFTIADEPELQIADIDKLKNPIRHFSTEIKLPRLKRGLDAPLSIKLTKLQNGTVLGIQCSHACMDGDSFYTMVNNWAKICRQETFDKPILDQSLYPRPEPISRDNAMQRALNAGWKRVTTFAFLTKFLPTFILGIARKRSRAFYFSSNTLANLKQKLRDDSGKNLSTNSVLSALLSKMCIKLYDYAQDTPCTQVTVTNCRMRLEGIPKNFTGNASTFIASKSFPASTDLGELALIIHNTLAPMLKTPSPELKQEIQLALNLLPHKLPIFSFDITEMHCNRPTVFHVNNFSRLPIYEVDFGSGRPVSVIPHDLGDPIVIWPTHPSRGVWRFIFPVRWR